MAALSSTGSQTNEAGPKPAQGICYTFASTLQTEVNDLLQLNNFILPLLDSVDTETDNQPSI